METENLPASWTTDAGLMTITLDRAPANALGLPLIEGLNAALDDAMDSDVRVIIITSAIEGFFAAGADIKLMATVDMTGFIAYGDALRATLNRIEESGAITIAAVDGLALGGGLELALACTFRVAGDGA
ncbi:enoyl-CoA hydratase/isomerase family protein [Microbacterium aurum]